MKTRKKKKKNGAFGRIRTCADKDPTRPERVPLTTRARMQLLLRVSSHFFLFIPGFAVQTGCFAVWGLYAPTTLKKKQMKRRGENTYCSDGIRVEENRIVAGGQGEFKGLREWGRKYNRKKKKCYST